MFAEERDVRVMATRSLLAVIGARLPGEFAWGFFSFIILACIYPSLFNWYNVDANLSLGLTMLLVGLAIDPADLAPADHAPAKPGRMGTSGHLGPSTAFWAWGAASGLFVFPVVTLLTALTLVTLGLVEVGGDLTLGLILLSACPIGSASNLVPARLAGMRVAPVAVLCTLFTFMAATTCPAILGATGTALQTLSTACGVVPPAWTAVLTWRMAAAAGAHAFFKHGMLSLLLPLSLGCASRVGCLAVGRRMGRGWEVKAETAIQAIPLLAPAGILVTAANKAALNASKLVNPFPQVVLLVAFVHAASYGLGYALPLMAGAPRHACRMCCIQAGARNPALGLPLAAALLQAGLGRSPALALAPCAISIFMQNIQGALLAWVWTASQ